jgi:hypothetical protein
MQLLAVAANELNRSMGLVDLVAEVLTEDVRRKTAFVHDLVRRCRVPELLRTG